VYSCVVFPKSYDGHYSLFDLNREVSMNLRKIISLTMLLSFVLCILTSIVLYIVPEGRIAYMKNKAREVKIFTSSFNVALILNLVVGLGTYWQIPPVHCPECRPLFHGCSGEKIW